MSLRGHEGVRKLKVSNASIELKLDLKYACDIPSMIKQMLCNKISLRGHKGVRTSKVSKRSN